MSRLFPTAAFAILALGSHHAFAQGPARSPHTSFPAGVIEGRVLDDTRTPVAGAMVSVVGRTTAVATTNNEGRYSLKELPFGPYVLSAHSRGYWQSRGRTVQLTAAKISAPEIQLSRVNAEKPVVAPAPARSSTQLAGFGGALEIPVAATSPSIQGAVETSAESQAAEGEGGETAWRLRHLPRSILKEVTAENLWLLDSEKPEGHGAWFGRSQGVVGPANLFSDLALSGQINLLTTESFDRPGQLFGANGSHSVAFVSVGTQAAGGAWSVQGAMTQGDLASWIVAGSYKSIDSARHAYDLGMSYATQRYDGGNVTALTAIRDNARNVGSVYGYDQWTVSPRLIVGYGSTFARYDYLRGEGLWSPRFSVTLPADGFRLTALVSRRDLAPGAEEFSPAVAGLWLPPERTFSSLSSNGSFRPEQTRHLQIALERDLDAGVTISLRGFGQRVNDQLVEMFGADLPGRADARLGHYFVGTAGDIDARGWGVGLTQQVPGYLRAVVEYTVATAYWLPSLDGTDLATRSLLSPSAFSENVHDLRTSVEATIPQTATKIVAMYRINTAFWGADAERISVPSANARFNVRVNQSLPFLRFSSADWEAMVDVRNMFRESDAYSSLYDEALALRAPKRIVGGLLLKF
jgi:Carboxypeptidase regulatory-like domain